MHNIEPAATDRIAPASASLETITSLARALRLLQAASSDWRHKGPTDGSDPLHWPAAVAAARAHIGHALQLLEGAP